MTTPYPHNRIFQVPAVRHLPSDFRKLAVALSNPKRRSNRLEISRIVDETQAIGEIAHVIVNLKALLYGAVWAVDRLVLLFNAHPDMLDGMFHIGVKITHLLGACLYRHQRLGPSDGKATRWLLKMCIVGVFSTFYETQGKTLCNMILDTWHWTGLNSHYGVPIFEDEILARDGDRHFVSNGVLAALLSPTAMLCCRRLRAVFDYVAQSQTHSLASLDRRIDPGLACDHVEAHDTVDKLRRLVFRRRTLEVATALQYLGLPVLMTLGIIDELLPNDYTMHYKWQLLKAVKHFGLAH